MENRLKRKRERRERKHESRDVITEQDEECNNPSNKLVKKTILQLALYIVTKEKLGDLE